MSRANRANPKTPPASTGGFSLGLQRLDDWFASLGRTPFEFQRQTWHAYLAGRDGLVHAPTGSGKTLAVFGGPLVERLNELESGSTSKLVRAKTDPLTLIWITPMRALANDTTHALSTAVAALGLPWSVELRTSDAGSTLRKKQRERLPSVFVTTPESLSLQLSYPESKLRLESARCVVVDEWHELLSTKRGVQTELALARLRRFNPHLRTWGLSATLGNLDQAAAALCPNRNPVLIHAPIEKTIMVESILPESIERFPWGGHMGLRLAEDVAREIGRGGSTLVFTNTRAQAEIWFKTLLNLRPDFLGRVAIHHGSLDRKLRLRVEAMLREGLLAAVVCTSSLDLGVDFTAVDRVIQIGSPKGVGRLLQRAGRSGHRPGEVSRVLCVPTHAFEIVEFSAARDGVKQREAEPRTPLRKPLDVLVQHLVTVAAGGGFRSEDMLAEVRSTHAFAELGEDEWNWSLDFVLRGGPTLTAYPRFARVTETAGVFRVASERVARLHRLAIGTIAADGVVSLVMNNGRKLGTIEESFVSRLRGGDRFVFGGRVLEFISLREMTARVRPAKKAGGTVPQWAGGRFPLSTLLADKVRKRLDDWKNGVVPDVEIERISPLLALQSRWSAVPSPDELLIEIAHSRDGGHAFMFSFLGRLVHEGLGAIVAHRIHRQLDLPVTATFTDYGIEFLCPESLALTERNWRELLSPANLLDDLVACLNAGELTRRQFREVARVAGLIVPSAPGQPRSNRQLQASAELFFDVFREFDPNNLLLEQARREVLERQLEIDRLRSSLDALRSQKMLIVETKRFTPMAFPIWAQRIASQTVRVEEASRRIERMMRQLEAAAVEPKPQRALQR